MKCAKCKKPSDELKAVLYIGDKGFRKYMLCPKCRQVVAQSALNGGKNV